MRYAVNISSHGSVSAYQNSSTLFYDFLNNDLSNVRQQCLNALIPFLCHLMFITCDPAFNASVQQNICRQTWESLTTFMCPEVTNILEQASNINSLVLSVPRHDSLMDANGDDAPDCISSSDGGKYKSYASEYNVDMIYHIAGNFQQKKILRFSRILTYPQK